MKEVFKIIEVKNSDRYIFITIDESRSNASAGGIVGVNFHQGIGEINWSYKEPNIHLTEIWRRITLKLPNVDYYQLLDKACDLYVDAFIIQTIS